MTGTILVVDDDEAICDLVKETLAPHTVLSAITGEDALRLLRGPTRVDVLLTDVVLPGRSGPELATELRARLPGLRVVLMSGYTAGLVAESAPADAVLLEKPFRAVALLTALRDALDAPQP